jgi:amino acid adenylation domain-containing protein
MNTTDLLADLQRKGIELWAEGESLRFRAPRGHLTADVRAALQEHKQALLEHLRLARRSAAARTAAAPPDDPSRFLPFPLTDIQHAYWIGRQGARDEGGVAAHSYLELCFDELDLERLTAALRRLIEHHDMLRMVVLPSGEQVVLASVPPLSIPTSDLTAASPEAARAHLEAIRAEMSHQVLPADRWPLFDLRASRCSGGQVHLHVSLDLLVADALSVVLLIEQCAALYQDPAAPLPALGSTFREYCVADARRRDPSTEAYQQALSYWRSRLETLPGPPELPLAPDDGGRAAQRFVRRKAGLDRASWRVFRDRALAAGVTPSMALCAAYGEVLRAFSRGDWLTLNLTLFNRLPLLEDVERIVGDFTSGILLEMDGSREESFSELASRVQHQLFEDLEHAVVSSVRVLREMARSSRFGAGTVMPYVFTSLLQDKGPRFPWGDGVRIVESVSQTPQVWLDHQVYELDGALHYTWDAVDSLFPEGLVDTLFEAYGRLLRRLSDDASAWQAPARQPLPPAQREKLAAFNATERPVSSERLEALFLRQAAAQPDSAAILTAEQSLSYGEVERRSAEVAAWLRRSGARPGRLVAVVMDKGPEQVIGALGILRAGSAYLPLDPALPAERLQALLAEAEVELALTQAHVDSALSWPVGVRRLSLDASGAGEASGAAPAETASFQAEDLAYVIYTSGSTGRPKGVMIDHRGAVNTILDVNSRFGVGPRDRTFALSSLSFDLSVYDIFGTLAAGGAIVYPEAGASRDPQRWLPLMRDAGVTLWNSVPALMEMLVESAEGAREGLPASLRLVLLSGDWIPTSLPDRIRALAPSAQVISLGGATEASIWSILHPIGAVDPKAPSIPYGRPMVNQRFYVLDERLYPCPEWVPGQLFIGGAGVALGYWRDPDRTQERFVIHPRTGERLYATGDLGRFLPDGNIEFLGREDLQVKIQGYRIELGEIEAALGHHPDVQSAAVVAVGAQRERRRLIAYVVPSDRGEPPPEAVATPGPSADPYLWGSLVEAGRKEAALLPAEGASIHGFMTALERASTVGICRTLSALGARSARSWRRAGSSPGTQSSSASGSMSWSRTAS